MKKILMIGAVLILAIFLSGCLFQDGIPEDESWDRIRDLEGTWMADENNVLTITIEDEFEGEIFLDTEFFNGDSPPNDGEWHHIIFDIFCGGPPPYDETPFCIAEEVVFPSSEEEGWVCIWDMQIKWLDKNTIMIDETDRYPKNLKFNRVD